MRATMPLAFEGLNTAPPGEDSDVMRMVAEMDQLVRRLAASKRPILVFLDSHKRDKLEPPYPPHYQRGSD